MMPFNCVKNMLRIATVYPQPPIHQEQWFTDYVKAG